MKRLSLAAGAAGASSVALSRAADATADAIKAMEAELNPLCQVGDKSANLISILPL